MSFVSGFIVGVLVSALVFVLRSERAARHHAAAINLLETELGVLRQEHNQHLKDSRRRMRDE